jgi:hypothetical protein
MEGVPKPELGNQTMEGVPKPELGNQTMERVPKRGASGPEEAEESRNS